MAEQKTEPPLTMSLSDREILDIIEKPLQLPHYPCHTQHVERIVPLVTESALQTVGYQNRHRLYFIHFGTYEIILLYRWILSTLESRKICPTFNTKKNDLVFD